MVVVDRGDDRRLGTGDDVRCIEAPAESHLENEIVGGSAREGEQRRGGRDLEERDGRARIGDLAFLEQCRQVLVGDMRAVARRARQPDALVEAHQMRRGVAVDLESGASAIVLR